MTYADLDDLTRLIGLVEQLDEETMSEKIGDACRVVRNAARARRSRLLRDMKGLPPVSRETPLTHHTLGPLSPP